MRGTAGSTVGLKGSEYSTLSSFAHELSIFYLIVQKKILLTMAKESKIKEFPDIKSKLQAPTKKSLFERQKAEAEAKRQREQQETAAVYEDFVKSFDDADEDQLVGPGGRPNSSFGGGGPGGPSRRHFGGPPTGPGGRGGLGGGRGSSGPGSLGPPPPSTSRKRGYDGIRSAQKDGSQGLFAFEDAGPVDVKTAFKSLEDEDEQSGRMRSHERAAPKPTLRLSSLPPATSPSVIKSIIPGTLNVDTVRILPPSGPGTMERRSLSAIVTLAKDTPAIDIDTAVSALQNKYLGWGFYLTLSRHLSSAAVGVEMPAPSGLSSGSSLPFGARPVPAAAGMGRPSQGMHRGGFAPPSSYTPSGPGLYGRGAPSVQVNVTPPADLKQLKLIHKTVEALLTHGPEFEALLMSRKDVQKDENWAWIWDSRSVGGVWYRWRLWEILTGVQRRKLHGQDRDSTTSKCIFDGAATWSVPDKSLPFEYTTQVEEFVSDSDYDSSEDEDSGDEGRRKHLHFSGGAPPPEVITNTLEPETQAYLNPLQKAKLTHLLARLPTTNAKLRRGDVARVTAFAIQHAGDGADEIVQMITSNVVFPFTFTGANPDRKLLSDDPPSRDETPDDLATKSSEKEDTSPSKLVALYLISDILSSSSTSGVRHAWRYRQLFETALKRLQIFEHLGRLEKDMQWGRLRAEKWKRSVGSVLSLWEGWCVFPQNSHEQFVKVFEKPPLTKKEGEEKENAEKEKKEMEGRSKWKVVDEKTKSKAEAVQAETVEEMDVDGEPMDEDNLDGEPMEDDGDVDGEPMDDGDGEEMVEEAPPHPAVDEMPTAGLQNNPVTKADTPAGARRKRPRAEDMFADSDDE